MRHLFRFLAAICLTVIGSMALAADVDVEGFKFSDAASVNGANLVLNGAATSSILSTKSTAVAFYLPKKQNTMEAAVAEKGAKRIQFYMLRDVSARDLSNAMLDRIRQNAAEDFAANIMQTAQLGVVFGNRAKVFKGDVMVIDYDPATQSTQFNLNGQKIGDTIKGEAFFPMMMKVWIGPKVRGSTRDALLGLPSGK
ncbi:chalcone isomerase family protein [Piscinibacter terrae]|uniref:Chalcone isomerase domain-containing protein n=1 Tax=Piscinibacter terrae TaxID=2496871 RepID=A0A3N7JPT4_9BURK|nr:chalcone isomerase family protein [Albitalea terrae]RQP23059.1 hypothetical protein DZC73_18205 [Albitalea terrae]